MQGLKEGQILRTISNMTYSDSHYTSDEDKLGEVSVCRPIPLSTLHSRPSLEQQKHPRTLYEATNAPLDSVDGPSLSCLPVHAYYVQRFRAGRHNSVT